ncbi:hypothetical protein [Companilactobacillus zhachilii]|uniref:hypothetical protein n=1 Tax=Companilactobacillus zhachilii TaxID=2304606 RepID=UPI0040336B3C
MKKFVRWVLVSALALISFGSFSQTAHAAGASDKDYVHTFKTTKLYAMKPETSNDWTPEFTEVTDRALSANTDWYTDGFRHGTEYLRGYHRVATNEWVKAEDIVYVENPDVKYPTEVSGPLYSFDFNSYKGKELNKTLPSGNWVIGSLVSLPDHTGFMQVGGNEWLKTFTEG